MGSGWRECKLGNLAEITSSKRIFYSDYVLEGIPFYRSKEIIERSLGEAGGEPLYISREKYFEIKEKFGAPQNGDLLISAVGERAGIPFVVRNQGDFYFKDGNLIWLRNIEPRLDIDYFCYWIKSSSGQMALESIMIGSAQKALTIVGLKGLEIPLPPFPEQQAIAAVLSSLDDKIDLLQRQNKTLEGMAEAIWRKMFVEEAEPGWREGKFGDEMSITMGQSPPGNTYNGEKQGIVFFQGRAEFDFRFPQTRLYCTEPKRLAKKGDTLVSVRAPVGDINVAYEDCCIGRGLAAVRHKGDCTSYTFYKTRSLKDDFDSFEQQGTVFGSIGKDDFNNIATRVPSGEAVQEFEHAARPIDDKIFTNSIQIRTLSRLRDVLLPKLMSGEVRVKH